MRTSRKLTTFRYSCCERLPGFDFGIVVETESNKPCAVLYLSKEAVDPITAGPLPPPPVLPWQKEHCFAKTLSPNLATSPAAGGVGALGSEGEESASKSVS